MSKVTRVSTAGQPRVSVQLTPGRGDIRDWGGNTGDTGTSREGGLSPGGSL